MFYCKDKFVKVLSPKNVKRLYLGTTIRGLSCRTTLIIVVISCLVADISKGISTVSGSYFILRKAFNNCKEILLEIIKNLCENVLEEERTLFCLIAVLALTFAHGEYFQCYQSLIP